MSSPYEDGRDSNAATSNRFDAAPEVADAHRGAFAASFAPPSDNLAEQDYRSTGDGVVPNPTDNAVPHGVHATPPSDVGYPTPRPGGAVNL